MSLNQPEHHEQNGEVWEVQAWTDYSADFPAKELTIRKFTVTQKQAEDSVFGAFGAAVKWANDNLLDPMVVSLRRVHPPANQKPGA